MLSSTAVLLALSSSVLANVFITSPVAGTTFTGGQQAVISWQDDGNSPSLTAFGPAFIGIYTGNAQQQTLLQMITPNPVNVATTSTVQFTPDPTIGPNGNNYFVRIQSQGLMDANQTQYPAEAFSSKFTMANMSGTFNATVQAEIDGQSTAPIGGTLPVSSPVASNTASTTPVSSSKASSSSAKPTGSATKSGSPSPSSGALGLDTSSARVLAAVVLGFAVVLY